MTLRLAFFGTGEFAVPSLKALVAAGHEVALVVCRPDRPRGRGHQTQPPPLKQAAQELGLRVWQPERVRDPESQKTFASEPLDLACVVSYGQILPATVLEFPRLGCVNVHASLLPRWRGAAPIEWALASGDGETGVCVQKMVQRLDAGDVLLSRRRVLGPEDDAPGLHRELALSGAGLLVEAVRGLESGTLKGAAQDESRVSLAPMLKKSDGFLDFTRPRAEILNRFRAFKARPGAGTALQGGEALKVLALEDGGEATGEAGRLLEIAGQGLRIACKDGSLWLERVLPGSGRPMDAAAYARGRRLEPGALFTAPAHQDPPSGDVDAGKR